MSGLQIFRNNDLGEIRVLEVNNEPYFIAKDVCEILDIKNTTQAISRLDEDERTMFNIGRQGNTNFVNEYGLYNLILASRKKEAKEFKRWITHEVIPSIRRNGGYILGQERLSDDELIQKALIVANRKIAEKDRLLEEQKPKVLFANSVETSENSILIGELSTLIKQNGYDIGQNRLFQWLRDNGFLGKHGEKRNAPTQKAMDLGLFEVKVRTVYNPDGSVRTTRTTKVTGKGQVYFINKFLNR